jgi:hypothetical protein
VSDAPDLLKRPRGNPVTLRRGQAVRAILAFTVKPGRPVPLHEVQDLVRLSQAAICRHLAVLQIEKRIKGYSTASGWVRVW